MGIFAGRMKRLQIIALLLLAVLAACTPHYEGNAIETRYGTSLPLVASPEMQSIRRTQLSAIDSLMWQQPDSALACLLSYFDTCRDVSRNVLETTNGNLSGDVSGNVSTDYDRHYAQLLLAELLYKNDYVQTNRNELLQAVEYFDSLVIVVDEADTRGVSLHGSGRGDASHASAEIVSAKTAAFLDARAHYINGVGYYENDSMVEACEEYLKALEVMDGHFEEEELKGQKAQFMALTCTRLTELYSQHYLHEPAIFWGKLSLPYYEKQQFSSWHLSWMLDEIGLHYDVMGDMDSAGYYYRKAAENLDGTNQLMRRDIMLHLIYYSYEKEGDTQFALHNLYDMLGQAESDREYYSRCLTIGEIFFHEQLYDSAWMYLSAVFDNTNSASAKKQAAEWLAEICKTLNKGQESLEYAEFLVPFANQEENSSGMKSQLTEQFNAFKQKRLEQQYHKRIHKQAQVAFWGFGGMCVIMFTIVFFYRRNKRSKQKLEAQIESERQAHQAQQAALAGRLRQSNEALKKHIKEKHDIVHSSSMVDQTSAESYVTEPICQRILAACNDKNNPIKSTVPVAAYADIALDNTMKAQLKNAAMRHLEPMFKEIKQQHPELKEKDFLYCYLSLLGLDNNQIAALLQNSVSTIWNRENRLKKIFGSESKIVVILHGYISN